MNDQINHNFITEEELIEEFGPGSFHDSINQSRNTSKRSLKVKDQTENIEKLIDQVMKEEKKVSISSSSFQSSSSSSDPSQKTTKNEKDADEFDFLDLSPPNFFLAEIHGSANKVKDLDRVRSKYIENSK